MAALQLSPIVPKAAIEMESASAISCGVAEGESGNDMVMVLRFMASSLSIFGQLRNSTTTAAAIMGPPITSGHVHGGQPSPNHSSIQSSIASLISGLHSAT
jgi:hypothetical protein